jgi:hypothetical protein
MTKTKLEFATILASLRKDGSDPQKLAQDMSLRKLLYEIERLEQTQEPPPPPKKETSVRSLWSWLTHDSDDD